MKLYKKYFLLLMFFASGAHAVYSVTHADCTNQNYAAKAQKYQAKMEAAQKAGNRTLAEKSKALMDTANDHKKACDQLNKQTSSPNPDLEPAPALK